MGTGRLSEGQDHDKGFVPVGRQQRLVDFLGIALDVGRGKDPAVDGHKVRRELNLHRPPRQGTEFLIEFAQMPVRGPQRIGVVALAQLGMKQVFLQAPPGTGDGAF